MRFGRCVKTNFGFMGCFTNVIDLLDRKCSGRQTCSVEVIEPTFDAIRPCNMELKSYLEADYICLKGKRATWRQTTSVWRVRGIAWWQTISVWRVWDIAWRQTIYVWMVRDIACRQTISVWRVWDIAWRQTISVWRVWDIAWRQTISVWRVKDIAWRQTISVWRVRGIPGYRLYLFEG